MSNDDERVHGAETRQALPRQVPRQAVRAEGRGRHAEGAAVRALRRQQALFPRRVPERLRSAVSGRIGDAGWRHAPERLRRVGDGHAYFLTIVALIGMVAGPPVKSAYSQPSTWLTAVPRTCSTAS